MKTVAAFTLSVIVICLTSCAANRTQPSSSTQDMNTLQPTQSEQTQTKLNNALKF